MARPPKAGLTDHELAIMRILWDASPQPVSGIRARLRRRPKPAYTSVLTVMQVMRRKGYVDCVKRGNAFHFHPVLKKDEYRRLELRRIVCALYDGDAVALVAGTVSGAKLAPGDVARLQKLLRSAARAAVTP